MDAQTAQTKDARTPTWAWIIFLLPLLVLLLISMTVYVSGYSSAKSLGASLVPIDASITSVKEVMCGGRFRYACYPIELSGSVDGRLNKYHTYDVASRLSSYGKTLRILVNAHPAKNEVSKVYWSKDGPVDDFKANSVFLLVLIAFEMGIGPVIFWLGGRKKKRKPC